MTTRVPLPTGIERGRLVVVVRGGQASNVVEACRTLVAVGIRAIEVTTNTRGWEDVVRVLADETSAEVGAGTVMTPAHVEQAVAAGARYVIAPDVDLEVGRAAAAFGAAWVPGALTPTEVRRAWDAGASAVKVFPAASVGGPAYLRHLRAPLDTIPLMPTGGVTADTVADYLAGGAVAVGVGSPLLGDALIDGDLRALADRARHFLAVAHG